LVRIAEIGLFQRKKNKKVHKTSPPETDGRLHEQDRKLRAKHNTGAVFPLNSKIVLIVPRFPFPVENPADRKLCEFGAIFGNSGVK
jgi:hypothetical protein